MLQSGMKSSSRLLNKRKSLVMVGLRAFHNLHDFVSGALGMVQRVRT